MTASISLALWLAAQPADSPDPLPRTSRSARHADVQSALQDEERADSEPKLDLGLVDTLERSVERGLEPDELDARARAAKVRASTAPSRRSALAAWVGASLFRERRPDQNRAGFELLAGIQVELDAFFLGSPPPIFSVPLEESRGALCARLAMRSDEAGDEPGGEGGSNPPAPRPSVARRRAIDARAQRARWRALACDPAAFARTPEAVDARGAM